MKEIPPEIIKSAITTVRQVLLRVIDLLSLIFIPKTREPYELIFELISYILLEHVLVDYISGILVIFYEEMIL